MTTKQPEPLLGACFDALQVATERLGQDKQAFLADDILQDATLMRLQEAGEYLARVRESYPDYYDQHHSTAWHNLIGLRNIIAHGYLQIDREKIWDIMLNDVPKLMQELKDLI